MTELEKLVKKYSKKYKESMIMVPGSDENPIKNVDIIPTGSLLLDKALGIGGYPMGSLTEIFGKESTGKTTLALEGLREAQKMGYWGIILDFEHALDAHYMENLGIDMNKVMIIQSDNGEDAFEMLEEIIISEGDGLGIIIVDSIAGINTKAEAGSSVGDQHIGLTARLINKVDRKFIPLIARKNIALIFINQLRANIGGYGLSETTTGGKSIRYFARIRMRISPAGYVDKGSDRIGIKSRIDIIKNKLAPAYQRAEIQIIYGQGIDRANEVVNYLVDVGKIERAGSWYKLDGETLGQGAENTYAENTDLLENLLRMGNEQKG